jgi:D-threo-aldose 1-dehydrogenase
MATSPIAREATTVDPPPDVALESVALGSTGHHVTRLGLGTAPLASAFWGNDEDTAQATARRAREAGVTFFDTAPLYGAGESETRLGAALRGRREAVVIATKVGRLLDPGPDGAVEAHFDFSYDAVRRSLDSSLGRLGVDRVDVVHIHDPDDHVDDALSGAHRALVELREQGVIDAVSLGTNSVQTAETFLDRCDLDCLMVAGRYTLLDQRAARLVDRCAERGIAYLAAGVFNSGVLARPSEQAWYDYAPAAAAVLARAGRIEQVCAEHGVTLRAAAMRFPLTHPAVTMIVVGMATPAEVDENVEAMHAAIPDELWSTLADAGLLTPATSPGGRG